MTLSDLASIGSFASGAAVVITLVFLAIQLRRNTAAVMRAEANATQAAASAFRLAIVTSRDVAGLVSVGLSDDSELDAVDELRLNQLFNEVVWFSQHVWDRERQGFFIEGEWERSTKIITDLLISRRGAQWWDRNKPDFPPGFVAKVDKALDIIRHDGGASGSVRG